MQGVSPAAKPNKPSGIPWPLNVRWPIALWNSLFTEAATFIEQPARDTQWNRGAYLVQGAGHCGSCRTRRNHHPQLPRLLEKHELAAGILAVINGYLGDRGLSLRQGTIVDATLINAPSSTKNKDGNATQKCTKPRRAISTISA